MGRQCHRFPAQSAINEVNFDIGPGIQHGC